MIRRLSILILLAASLTAPLAAVEWKVADDDARARLVRADLEAWNAHLSESMRREKFRAMDDSAFTFLRGSAHLYHRDLLESAVLDESAFRLPGVVTWLQGDAHVRNVGVFADDGGEVIFDLDDFDQAWPGSYLVDVWRMASSLHVFAGEVGVAEAGERAVRAFAASYVETAAGFAGNDDEEAFRLDEDEARGPARRLIEETLHEEGTVVMLKEWTRGTKERRRFRSRDDLDEPDEALESALRAAVTSWASQSEGFDDGYFHILDLARRLEAGIGSRGVDRYYVLVEGPSGSDDIILDLKAQVAEPSLARFFAPLAGQPVAGCRVALAERALLAGADGHLGCLDVDGRSFSVRRRNPYKKSMKAKKIEGSGDLEALAVELGRVLAAAHARADADFAPGGVAASFDDAFAAAVLGEGARQAFIAEVSAFAAGYARQIQLDYAIFLSTRR